MDKKNIEICWLDADRDGDLALPCYHSEFAAGMDICAAVTESYRLEPGTIHLFGTGFCLAIPAGYEIQVRPRSGLAVKYGVTVVNSPGTIDADYRGEVRVGLINLGRDAYTVRRGDRIAQMILAPVVRAQLKLRTELDETERGAGGFGHSGV